MGFKIEYLQEGPFVVARLLLPRLVERCPEWHNLEIGRVRINKGDADLGGPLVNGMHDFQKACEAAVGLIVCRL